MPDELSLRSSFRTEGAVGKTRSSANGDERGGGSFDQVLEFPAVELDVDPIPARYEQKLVDETLEPRLVLLREDVFGSGAER